MTPEPTFEVWAVTVPAEAAQLPFARHALDRWLAAQQVPSPTRGDVVWAADEAMTNAIVHGYRHRGRTTLAGLIGLSVHMDDEVVVVTVVDHGSWRMPEEGAIVAGRGMTVVRALADHVHLSVDDDRTTFTACFTR
ncbi:ATP-binding protein [Actinokineospora iranica]|uniref:Anti-sigma regulatory factor (Ser/Thr protein kinase) n=1 Tax=Actinokineospora iranica TaxID=1271860 RepID=A0A1G6XH80_9PSEU|nr:ATP-binding protein [Actinokineospora iranica]SDD76685.1 Anti-sigma regulatory factor (Ser/Thr protein kinase) [Actinokineospora iranica]